MVHYQNERSVRVESIALVDCSLVDNIAFQEFVELRRANVENSKILLAGLAQTFGSVFIGCKMNMGEARDRMPRKTVYVTGKLSCLDMRDWNAMKSARNRAYELFATISRQQHERRLILFQNVGQRQAKNRQ